ncbi:innexin inx2-like [Brevipalpus obovatus]|uniref:innexin inx2-like n=1 Tax=Brevipalpus obovatus TaxID=246614 RepID=UPI003D9DBD52
MDQLFSSLKNFIKPQSCITDNAIFRLHYKFSVCLLVAFSIMVTARQYFGDPIDCISRDDIPNNLLDTFCWIHTTFSIDEAWFKKVGSEIPYPGVDKTTEGKKRIYHAYYQWVCFVLFFQAIFFYVPRYVWKAAEGGRIKNLILGLNSPIISKKDKETSLELLTGYLRENVGKNNTQFFVFCFAELLNLLNVILQMYVMNRFLGGEFIKYGYNVIAFSEWDWSLRYDPMIKVFPRLTKCTFHRYGSSGDVQKHDAMCILPINIINEKIYIFLWFWFVFLFLATLGGLAYRACTIMMPRLRTKIIASRCRLAEEKVLNKVLEDAQVGDWFLLDLLAKNMDSINYKDLLWKLYKMKDGGKAADAI